MKHEHELLEIWRSEKGWWWCVQLPGVVRGYPTREMAEASVETAKSLYKKIKEKFEKEFAEVHVQSDMPHEFVKWAHENGVSLEYPDDYEPWLHCFMAGYQLGVHDYDDSRKAGKSVKENSPE